MAPAIRLDQTGSFDRSEATAIGHSEHRRENIPQPGARKSLIKFAQRRGTSSQKSRFKLQERLKTEVAMENWTNAKLCDVANLILGAVLFFAPWIFGFDAGKVSENAYVSGIVIVVLALAALAAFAIWEEWLNLIVGLWTLVSPWVLGFQGTKAMTVHVIIGIAVAVLAAIEIWITSQNPPRLTASR
jgi:hypothetical protein